MEPGWFICTTCILCSKDCKEYNIKTVKSSDGAVLWRSGILLMFAKISLLFGWFKVVVRHCRFVYNYYYPEGDTSPNYVCNNGEKFSVLQIVLLLLEVHCNFILLK